MLRLLTLSVVSCLALSSPAAGQFGNILKKGKDKAAKEAAKAVGVETTQPASTLKFDNTMLELTTPVVNQLIAGLKVRGNTKDAKGRNSADLRRQADKAYKESEDLNRDRSDERFQYNNKKGEADNCVSEHVGELKQQHSDALQKKLMGMTGANLQGAQSANAKWMQEMQAAQLELAAAYNSGDTVRIRKAEAASNKVLGLDPKADSAKAKAKCNVPPPPPWMVRADSLSAESNRLYNEARDLEQKSNEAAIRASGQTAEQFAMGVERVTAHCGGGGGLWKFSKTEETALKDAKPQICPLIV